MGNLGFAPLVISICKALTSASLLGLGLMVSVSDFFCDEYAGVNASPGGVLEGF